VWAISLIRPGWPPPKTPKTCETRPERAVSLVLLVSWIGASQLHSQTCRAPSRRSAGLARCPLQWPLPPSPSAFSLRIVACCSTVTVVRPGPPGTAWAVSRREESENASARSEQDCGLATPSVDCDDNLGFPSRECRAWHEHRRLLPGWQAMDATPQREMGKEHAVPAHHKVVECLDAYLAPGEYRVVR
jgi:hypothetical protein